MAQLLVGPLLRWVGDGAATIFVEADRPGSVEVLGARAKTFSVEGHHFALVVVPELAAGRTHEYDVRFEGELVWPPPGTPFPASRIRMPADGDAVRLAFGSCRVAGPRSAPPLISRLLGASDPWQDALLAFARRLLEAPPEDWPTLLLLLGDQVYADDVPEATRAGMAERRGTSPGQESAVRDFEDYARLYRDSWNDPLLRWLLSTVPNAMVLDDHEVIDDWRISRAWLDAMAEEESWPERLSGALMGYWIYQHLGNVSPAWLAEDPLLRDVQEAADGGDRLRRGVMGPLADGTGSRWAFRRDLGEVRIVVLDTRGTRVLDEGQRDILDEATWQWLEEHVAAARHLVVACSVPFIYAHGIHHLQAWSERVAAGAWGERAARLVERLRRRLSLSGWPAFGRSFERLGRLLAEVGSGQRGARPASVTLLSGDVHHGYVARLRWPATTNVATPVHQVVCSPFRNPLRPHERWAQRFAASRLGELLFRGLARSARVPDPGLDWFRRRGLAFDNHVAVLTFERDEVSLRAHRAIRGEAAEAVLTDLWAVRLAGAVEPSEPRG